ncbi:MAG: molybdopterin-dependent oxidoreductase [Alphaproteobacteria bacterium]|nr:molybdopterin-dependent oxidoreductase [Alphaproteobacteria bacterium]
MADDAAVALKERYVGQPVERVEDATLLTGKAQFSDHLPTRAGTLHAAILRSPHAHARILSIDTSKAAARPGVAAVITGEDVRAISDPFLIVLRQPMHQWALAVDKVRYVGDPVVCVVADDRYHAEDALAFIDVEYEVLPAVVDQEAACEDGMPLVHEAMGANVASVRDFTYGDPDKAFAEADRIVKLRTYYPRNSQTPLEGFVVNAEYHSGENLYDVASNYQGPFTSHPVMSLALRVRNSQLRMRTPQWSGGGFGIKVQIFPYVVLMCLASKIAGRPVKWVEDRLEHLAAAAAAPNRVTTIEAAVKNDGTVTAFRFDQLDDYGAFLRAPMPGPLYRMHGILTGAYDIKNLAVTNRVVMTNKCPSSMVRGFGGPQMYFAIERLMHKVAVEIGMDPLEVMRRNLVPEGVFPYRAAAGALLDSGNYPEAIERAVNEGGLAELVRRRDAARKEGRLYGIGLATIVEPAQSNMGYLSNILPRDERARNPKGGAVANATVNVDPLGTVSVTADSIPQGQGHMTVLAQIVADELGLTPDDIKVSLDFDTAKDAWSIATGNYSSRFSSATAVAASKAARKVRDKLARIAAPGLNVEPEKLEFAGGKIFDPVNPDNAVNLYRVAGSAHWTPGNLPEGMEPCVRETGSWSPPELESPNELDQINTSLTYGFVFDFCGIEIDRDTGMVRIDKYVTMHDSGVLLNPLIANGQVYGAFAWAVGCALFEEFVYGDDGSFKTGTFADYLVPTSFEVPEPQILHMESPSTVSPLGAKGIGEGNCMSTPVCIANAVADALEAEGVNTDDLALPLHPSRIAKLIHGAETAPAAGRPELRPHPEKPAAGHMLTGDGETFVPAPPEEVWRTLLDEDSLAAVIPGCHRLDRLGENDYRADVSVGVGPVRGRFIAKVKLDELVEPESAKLSGSLTGPLGASQGEGHVRLTPEANGTRVSYDYSIVLTGTVASVGGRMLEGAARALVRQFFNRLVAQVGGGPEPAESWWSRLLRELGIRK